MVHHGNPFLNPAVQASGQIFVAPPATGDPETDWTNLQRTLNQAALAAGSQHRGYTDLHVVYLPPSDQPYVVRDPLIVWLGAVVGDAQAKTTIRLAPSSYPKAAVGKGATAMQPMLVTMHTAILLDQKHLQKLRPADYREIFSREKGGHPVWNHYFNNTFFVRLENLRLELDRNNAGATALAWTVAQGSLLKDVEVQNLAADRTGIGIDLGSSGGTFQDVTISGFEHGLKGTPATLMYRHLTIRDCTIGVGCGGTQETYCRLVVENCERPFVGYGHGVGVYGARIGRTGAGATGPLIRGGNFHGEYLQFFDDANIEGRAPLLRSSTRLSGPSGTRLNRLTNKPVQVVSPRVSSAQAEWPLPPLPIAYLDRKPTPMGSAGRGYLLATDPAFGITNSPPPLAGDLGGLGTENDDGPGFQAAVKAARKNECDLIIPPGHYYVESTVEVPQGTRIYGLGGVHWVLKDGTWTDLAQDSKNQAPQRVPEASLQPMVRLLSGRMDGGPTVLNNLRFETTKSEHINATKVNDNYRAVLLQWEGDAELIQLVAEGRESGAHTNIRCLGQARGWGMEVLANCRTHNPLRGANDRDCLVGFSAKKIRGPLTLFGLDTEHPSGPCIDLDGSSSISLLNTRFEATGAYRPAVKNVRHQRIRVRGCSDILINNSVFNPMFPKMSVHDDPGLHAREVATRGFFEIIDSSNVQVHGMTHMMFSREAYQWKFPLAEIIDSSTRQSTTIPATDFFRYPEHNHRAALAVGLLRSGQIAEWRFDGSTSEVPLLARGRASAEDGRIGKGGRLEVDPSTVHPELSATDLAISATLKAVHSSSKTDSVPLWEWRSRHPIPGRSDVFGCRVELRPDRRVAVLVRTPEGLARSLKENDPSLAVQHLVSEEPWPEGRGQLAVVIDLDENSVDEADPKRGPLAAVQLLINDRPACTPKVIRGWWNPACETLILGGGDGVLDFDSVEIRADGSPLSQGEVQF